ncbi:MAG: DUF4388 domain-containing protein [Candidatus Krumholzibacteria bacterium]|nr:DUF4388 domain-containing protein [Candidatus Krumholzibacteria bacterium]
MALEGNVKDFGLSEIFQLIAIQKKSGMLSVAGGNTMVIFFKDGKVISTRDRRNKIHDPLKDYLIRYGFIYADEMNKIQRIQAKTNLDLTDILVSEKYFSEDELKVIFAEQIQESIQEVLSWPKSHYKFIIGKQVLHGINAFASLKVEGLLMESMRRIDEFPEFKRIFPSEEMVLMRLDASGEKPAELDEHEEFIYDLLENELSLAELTSHARMPRFCTYESLKTLIEKGMLQIIKKPKPLENEIEETTAEEKVIKKKKVAPTAAAVFILLASFAIGEYVIPAAMPPGWSASSHGSMKETHPTGGSFLASNLDELDLHNLEASVREGLEEYFAAKGSYPFTLEILAVRKFVPEEIIEQMHQSGLRYRTRKNCTSYSLTPVQR